jgi:hypothetical protein
MCEHLGCIETGHRCIQEPAATRRISFLLAYPLMFDQAKCGVHEGATLVVDGRTFVPGADHHRGILHLGAFATSNPSIEDHVQALSLDRFGESLHPYNGPTCNTCSSASLNILSPGSRISCPGMSLLRYRHYGWQPNGSYSCDSL